MFRTLILTIEAIGEEGAVPDDLRAGTRAPRTLLELLIKQREATYEEQAAAFEKAARELGEPGLRPRHRRAARAATRQRITSA
ncbi:MAG: hypothetical protein L0H84_12055, partial [Pseudonocardia sp.]|nr:hypothetical protein [Pseudonocardia sp.]